MSEEHTHTAERPKVSTGILHQPSSIVPPDKAVSDQQPVAPPVLLEKLVSEVPDVGDKATVHIAVENGGVQVNGEFLDLVRSDPQTPPPSLKK